MEHSFTVRKEDTEEKANDVLNHEIDLYTEDGDIGLYCHTHKTYLMGIYGDEIVLFGDSCMCTKEVVVPLDDEFTKRRDK